MAARLTETYQHAARAIADVLDEAVQVNRDTAAWNAQAAGGRIDALQQVQKPVGHCRSVRSLMASTAPHSPAAAARCTSC